MKYRACKKVSRQRRRQKDPHQKQYARSPSVGDIITQVEKPTNRVNNFEIKETSNKPKRCLITQ